MKKWEKTKVLSSEHFRIPITNTFTIVVRKIQDKSIISGAGIKPTLYNIYSADRSKVTIQQKTNQGKENVTIDRIKQKSAYSREGRSSGMSM